MSSTSLQVPQAPSIHLAASSPEPTRLDVSAAAQSIGETKTLEDATITALCPSSLSAMERSLILGEPAPLTVIEASDIESQSRHYVQQLIRSSNPQAELQSAVAQQPRSAIAHQLPSRDDIRMQRVLTPPRSLAELIHGREVKFKVLVNSLVQEYGTHHQNPVSGKFERVGLGSNPLRASDVGHTHVDRVKEAYGELVNSLKLAGPNFEREFAVLKTELLLQVTAGLRGRYRASTNDEASHTASRETAFALPTPSQLEDMLFGVKGAADAALAPLFSMSFDLNKASDERKLNKRDEASADFGDPIAAKYALKTAFATSSAMFVQAQALHEASMPHLSSFDQPVANRGRDLLNVFDHYVSACEARLQRGEVVDVGVLSQIKGLLDKSWDPRFGGVGRFSPQNAVAKPSIDGYFTKFDLSTDLKGNRLALGALREALNFYQQQMPEFERQSHRDPLLADLRAVQIHSMVGQLINDLVLNPGFKAPPKSEELMRFYEGLATALLSKTKAANIAEVASFQKAMRSSPLLMELPLEHITAPIAASLAQCLGGGDEREAANTSLIQEALHLSAGSKRDLLIGIRGRYQGVDRGVAIEITGRFDKPSGIMGMPDEGLDPQADRLASGLCDELVDQSGVGNELLNALKDPAYAAGERPVTVLRDRTLPTQIEALVNPKYFEAVAGHDDGTKRAELLVRQLDKLADETKFAIERVRTDQTGLLTHARSLVRPDFKPGDFADLLKDHKRQVLWTDLAYALEALKDDSLLDDAQRQRLQALIADRQRAVPKMIDLALSYDIANKTAMSLQKKRAQIEALRKDLLPASLAPIARHDALPRGMTLGGEQYLMGSKASLKADIGKLDFKGIKVLDLQGRMHELSALGERETTAGLIHRSGQRTYCSISGTTADLVLALYAQYGPDRLSPLLDSIWAASESGPWSGLSADAKSLAAVVSVFMQRGGYHTPAEVFGGLLVAAAAMKSSPEASDGSLMAKRYEQLLDRLSKDPAAFFIVNEHHAKSFREKIGDQADRLIERSSGLGLDEPTTIQADNSLGSTQSNSADDAARSPSNPKAPAPSREQPEVSADQHPAIAPARAQTSVSSAPADLPASATDDVRRYPQVLSFEAAQERETVRAKAAGALYVRQAEKLKERLSLTTDAMNLPLTLIGGAIDMYEPALQLDLKLADDPFKDLLDSIEGLNEASLAISTLLTTITIARYAISIKKAAAVKEALINNLNEAEVKLDQTKDLAKVIAQLITKRESLNSLKPNNDAQAKQKTEALLHLDKTLDRLQQAYSRLQVIEPNLKQKIQTLRYKLDEANWKKARFVSGIAYKSLRATKEFAGLATSAAGTTVATVANYASAVFLIPALISTVASTKRAYDNTRDAIRLQKDRKVVDEQIRSLRSAVAAAFTPPLSDDKLIDEALENRPSERAMLDMLMASRDNLKREHGISAGSAVAESLGAAASALSVVAGALSIAGIVGAGPTLGISLAVSAVGVVIGGIAVGINIGLWLYKRHLAKQRQDKLHDAQTGLESFRAGVSLDRVCHLNPFVATTRLAAIRELKRSGNVVNPDAVEREVQARCEALIKASHVNQHASTVTTLMTRELNEMGRFVEACAANAALNDALRLALGPEEKKLLDQVTRDRPQGQKGSIPPPNPSDKGLQRRYLALVSKLLLISNRDKARGQAQTGANSGLLMKRFPISSVLAMKSETDSAVDGSLALADIFYAGGHRASSDALLIQTGLAPLIVEDRAAGDYFAPIPQGPLRQVGTTGLVNINAQESASSVVSLVLRSEPRLANMVLSPKDLGTLTASTVQTNETENEPLRHHLMTAGGQASTPGSLLDNLLGSKSGQGLLITVDRSNAPVASRSKLGRAVTGESMGRAFSNMTDAYLANRQGLASEPFFFMSIDLERGNHDKRFLSIPVRPDLPNRAPDGSVRQMDFIACNRSRDRLRPEYITYEKLGDNWFVRTTDKLTRVEMKPETIESKINDIITPYEEKITYLQLRKDLQENACLVKFSKV